MQTTNLFGNFQSFVLERNRKHRKRSGCRRWVCSELRPPTNRHDPSLKIMTYVESFGLSASARWDFETTQDVKRGLGVRRRLNNRPCREQNIHAEESDQYALQLFDISQFFAFSIMTYNIWHMTAVTEVHFIIVQLCKTCKASVLFYWYEILDIFKICRGVSLKTRLHPCSMYNSCQHAIRNHVYKICNVCPCTHIKTFLLTNSGQLEMASRNHAVFPPACLLQLPCTQSIVRFCIMWWNRQFAARVFRQLPCNCLVNNLISRISIDNTLYTRRTAELDAEGSASVSQCAVITLSPSFGNMHTSVTFFTFSNTPFDAQRFFLCNKLQAAFRRVLVSHLSIPFQYLCFNLGVINQLSSVAIVFSSFSSEAERFLCASLHTCKTREAYSY